MATLVKRVVAKNTQDENTFRNIIIQKKIPYKHTKQPHKRHRPFSELYHYDKINFDRKVTCYYFSGPMYVSVHFDGEFWYPVTCLVMEMASH